MPDADSHRSSGPVVAFGGGGTGGHLFPALAVAAAIQARVPTARFQYFATQRAIDSRILGGVRGEIVEQPIPRLSRLPWRWPGILRRLRDALAGVRRRFDAEPPDVVVGTGGLASIPVMWEAVRRGIPTAILNPDALPGRANRWLARYADTVFVQWEETAEQLSQSREVKVFGCPIRADFLHAPGFDAHGHFGLRAGRQTLLVTGASQGARSINDAVLALASRLAGMADWQILHLTGETDFERTVEQYRQLNIPSAVHRFTDRMADAIRIADAMISRAGASTLAEITAIGRASILMPYPYHRDQHQEANARCLVRRGAGLLVRDRIEISRNAPALLEALSPLTTDGVFRRTLADAAREAGRCDAADRIAEHILSPAFFRKPLAPNESLQVIYGGTR
jgi:UDP-N-acetylglucosamine--N-acetylmuramyl-(pentapeptide) pyrophosphoryl-undecaprenol N-acetylglucosamine transferase